MPYELKEMRCRAEIATGNAEDGFLVRSRRRGSPVIKFLAPLNDLTTLLMVSKVFTEVLGELGYTFKDFLTRHGKELWARPNERIASGTSRKAQDGSGARCLDTRIGRATARSRQRRRCARRSSLRQIPVR